MRVKVEEQPADSWGPRFVLRLLDGYRAGKLVSQNIGLHNEAPIVWRDGLLPQCFAGMAGYQVVTEEIA